MATPNFKHLLLQCLLYLCTEYPLNSVSTYTKIAISREPTLVPQSNLGIQLTILHRLSNQKLKKIKNAFFEIYLIKCSFGDL